MNEREFVLTDGKKFIRQNLDNKFVTTLNLSLADVFMSQKAADNIKKNSLTKAMSRMFYVAEVVNGKIIQCDHQRPQKIEKSNRNNEFYFTQENKFVDTKWHKGFSGLLDLFNEASTRRNELSQELSNIEAEIVDIEHYIEFTSLNARDGYKIYRKLRDLLRERRYIKDEQKVVNAINSNCAATEQIKNIVAVLDAKDNRNYKPRVLVDLFKHGVNYQKSLNLDIAKRT